MQHVVLVGRQVYHLTSPTLRNTLLSARLFANDHHSHLTLLNQRHNDALFTLANNRLRVNVGHLDGVRRFNQ